MGQVDGRQMSNRIASVVVAVVFSAALLTGSSVGAAPVHDILFPVASDHLDDLRWSDTWGAPRSGGRSHIGVDLLGEKMMRQVAVSDSEVTWGRFDNERGSIIRLRDISGSGSGWEYQYIHINNDTPGTDDGAASCTQAFSAKICASLDGSKLQKGMTFKAGEFISYMGDSGNAEWTTPHLHFEMYAPTGDGVRAVNPTPYTDAAADRLRSGDGSPTTTDPGKHSDVSLADIRRQLPSDLDQAAYEMWQHFQGREPTDAELFALTTSIADNGAVATLADVASANPTVAQIDRLYLAFFNRSPDDAGLAYWVDVNGGGYPLEHIAELFSVSPEYQQRYDNIDFSTFLDRLYIDVMGRQPDDDGKRYWLSELEAGRVTRGSIVVYFTEGEELKERHINRTELMVIHRSLGLQRPSHNEVEAWSTLRKSADLSDSIYRQFGSS